MMAIEKTQFGVTRDGQPVYRYDLNSDGGSRVSVLNYGGIVQSILVPDRSGVLRDVCLGYNSVEDYENDTEYIGATIGRFAGRIGRGAFSLGEKEYRLGINDPPNHLHGGMTGFHKRMFDSKIQGEHLILSRVSPDGEEGYPGTLTVDVRFHFSGGTLTIQYFSHSDMDTIVGLTNHTYFNLNGEGGGSILNHKLRLFAGSYTEIDGNCLPTGLISSVKNTPFDFLRAKAIGQDIEAAHSQLIYGNGYDHNFVLDSRDEMKPAAELTSTDSGIRLTIITSKPGIQFYTGNSLSGRQGKTGLNGKRGAVCLETQFFPDATAHSHFPSPILKSGDLYRHQTVYQFTR